MVIVTLGTNANDILDWNDKWSWRCISRCSLCTNPRGILILGDVFHFYVHGKALQWKMGIINCGDLKSRNWYYINSTFSHTVTFDESQIRLKPDVLPYLRFKKNILSIMAMESNHGRSVPDMVWNLPRREIYLHQDNIWFSINKDIKTTRVLQWIRVSLVGSCIQCHLYEACALPHITKIHPSIGMLFSAGFFIW